MLRFFNAIPVYRKDKTKAIQAIKDKINVPSEEEISGALGNVQDTLSGLLGGLG